MTLPPVRQARARHHASPLARACAWTRAGQWQLGLDLPWQVRQPGWTPLGDCGVQVAVRCHSADPTLRIGGDWHLSMPLPGGDLLLAVGDVGGHGLPAAVEMLRLRYAMASFATACADPAAILCHLNKALCRRGDATATAVAARFSPRSGELTWAQAGHPPVIVASGDRARRLPSPAGTMLGVVPHARYDRAAARLRPGDFIVLYTDGVFRRRESVDEGINAMARLAASARCCPPALLDHVDYGAAGDDACVLVAERVR
jgi:serine phosphatase RsbU (regulator of sigma subunit)